MKNKCIVSRCIEFILMFALVFICVGITAYADDSFDTNAAPQNVVWKEAATATATWDAFEQANYYLVDVYVEYENEVIGETQTGTSSTEIDLQQEINQIIGEETYSTVDVCFAVTAQSVQPDQEILSSERSEISGKLYYSKSKFHQLKTPTNVELSDSLILSFDKVSFAELYGYHYSIECEDNIFYGSAFIFPSEEDTSDQVEVSTYENILNECNKLGLVGKDVKIQVKVWADTYGNTGSDYTISDYASSNEINLQVEEYSIPKLSTPVIESFDADKLELSATFDERALTCTFLIDYYVDEDEHGLFSWGFMRGDYGYLKAGEGEVWASLKNKIYTALVQEGVVNKECKIRIGIYTTADETIDNTSVMKYQDSDCSEWTEEVVHYIAELERLDKPSNLKWQVEDDEYAIICDRDERSMNIQTLEVRFRTDETEKIMNTNSSSYITITGKLRVVIDIYDSFKESELETFPVYASVRLNYEPAEEYANELQASEMSDWSEEILYTPETKSHVESIILSPTNPVCAVGRSLYIGKTIEPEDAYYESIEWSSDNEEVATVDGTGKITAKSVGTANIEAKISDISDSISVSVYEVGSNVEDEKDKEQVEDTAGAIIDEIVNAEEPDLSATDLTEEEVAEIKEEIYEAVERNDTFRSDILLNKQDLEHFKEYWDEIQKQAEDVDYACGFDIGVEIYHQDKEGKKYHIANITQFENEIGFTIDADEFTENTPEELQELTLIRIHDGVLEEIPFDVNNDGSVTVKSDKFSDFIFVSKETAKTNLDMDDKGDWYLYKNGSIDYSYTGLYEDSIHGWWLVEEGKVNFDYFDLYCDANVGWWKISGGTVDFGYTDLFESPTCGWWKVNGGQVDFGYTDLYESPSCGWWKVNGGQVDFGYTDLYESPSCGWWKVNGGAVDFGYTDLYESPSCGWWKISGGAVDFGYTDLYESPSCGWWKVNGGAVDFGYTDLYGSPAYGWWKVSGGAVDFGYNDIFASPTCGYWKIAGGAVDFGYNGVYNSQRYGQHYISGGAVAY